MAICNGQYPEFLNYDIKMMRKHLARCLEDQVFRYFPASRREITQETKKSEVIKIYCTCRLPDGGERTTACDKCGECGIMRLGSLILYENRDPESPFSYDRGINILSCEGVQNFLRGCKRSRMRVLNIPGYQISCETGLYSLAPLITLQGV